MKPTKNLLHASSYLEGGHIVMNSVAAGKAMIVDAAIERALGEPLRESELEKQAEEALRKAAAQKQKKEAKTLNQNAKRATKVKQACRNLISGRAQGDASKLAIQDLLTLISWKNGSPPENKSAVAPRKRSPEAATNQQKKRSKKAADSSDEDESSDLEEDGDRQSDMEDGSDSEDDSDEDDEPAKEEGGGCGQEEEEVA
mmetsp:Transcript_4530/g.9910  ORF Transcript_4530/g.9910 Transcript_4530/m.9910 type:complete len:200 (+) Transcript_4530:760-1359(+)